MSGSEKKDINNIIVIAINSVIYSILLGPTVFFLISILLWLISPEIYDSMSAVYLREGGFIISGLIRIIIIAIPVTFIILYGKEYEKF